MLAAPGLSSYGFTFDNWGANPSGTLGTSVVPGASNVEGSWTQIASGANIARDCHWLEVRVHSGSTSTAQKDMLLDIGVDDAGGSSYAAKISDIVCGGTSNLSTSGGGFGGGIAFLLPIFIKAGSSVAARVQGSNATAGTVRVTAKFFGDPSNPENIPVGQYSETIGTITNSAGVSFTPGNAADGTWVSLGATAREMWWWQLGVQLSSAAIVTSNIYTYVELAYGDATNKITIQREMFNQATTEDIAQLLEANLNWLNCYQYVPAATNIYVRGRSSASGNSGWNAVAIGIGG